MSEQTRFESESVEPRADVAALFHRIGDSLRDGSPVTFREGDQTVAVSVPSELSLSVELERETDDGGREATELELELEWEGAESEAEPATDQSAAADLTASDESPPASLGRFEVYRDRAEEWRWRLVHRNGNIIATSGEGYTSRQNAEKGLRSVMANAPDASVTTEE